jgi:hypothetical protein
MMMMMMMMMMMVMVMMMMTMMMIIIKIILVIINAFPVASAERISCSHLWPSTHGPSNLTRAFCLHNTMCRLRDVVNLRVVS